MTSIDKRPNGSYRAPKGTLVYVAYGRLGVLYVGVTENLFARMTQHRKGSVWWPDMERLEWEEWPDRAAALRREAELVEAQRPPYNFTGKPGGRPSGG